MRKIVYFDHTTGGKHRIDILAEALGVERISMYDESKVGDNDICFVEGFEVNAVASSSVGKGKVVLRLNAMEIYKGTVVRKINWKNVECVFVHSKQLKEYFLERHGKMPADKIHVTGLIIDMDKFKFKDHTGSKIAVNSEVHWRKGVQRIPELLKELPSQYHVYHIGKIINEDCFNYLNWKLKEWGLSDRYHYECTTGDVPTWLQDKDFIFHPSMTEGCPRAVGEAMSVGLIPIVYNYRGAQQQQPYAWETIAMAVELILKPKITPKECREWVLTHYSKDVVVNKFKKVLCTI